MSAKEIPFGKISGDKIILNTWGNSPEREIGEIRGSEEESVQYFVDRFEELKAKIVALEEEIEASQNKGSFLMKLLHLRKSLLEHDGLGDYQALDEKLARQEALLNDIIEKNREKNTEIKTALLEEMKAAVEKINWKEATVEIHDIKARWIKTGNPKEALHESLEEEFWGLVDGFFEKKKQFYEDKKLLGEKRKKAYEEVIMKAERIQSLFGKARFEEIDKLKEEWQNIGNIPKEEYTPLLRIFNQKIKSAPKRPTTNLNIDDLLKQIERMTNGDAHYNYKEISGIKEQLKKYRPAKPDERSKKHTAFQNIQLLTERDFIDKLAFKRFKNFKELEKPKKQKIRIGILEELLSRDRTDLQKYQENSANFTTSGSGMMSLVEKKIQQQQSKIEIKERLLKMLKEKG